MADADVPTAAVLSSLADQVDQVLDRVTAGAEASDRSRSEDLASVLFDAERALRAARRALERAERLAD